MVKASICTIGDEILIGQIVDTNSSEISRALGETGVRCTRMLSIGDDSETIISNLENELKINEIVVVTGGLGPTKDDITKPALARLSGAKAMVLHKAQEAKIIEILSSRGLDVLDINKAQAMVPDTCEVIVNQKGTAPIMVFRFPPSRFGHEAVLYSLPGVPFEAIGALPEVIEDIKSHFQPTSISHRTVMTFGMAESALSKLIEPWEDSLPKDMHLAYLPNPLTGVRLRLSIYGGDKESHKGRLEERIEALKAILGETIYSDSDDTLQHAIGELLLRYNKTMAAAESCTGGLISHLMTGVPGASAYYLGSVTSYANEVKENVLGVPSEIIDTFDPVSKECVEKMAEGARRITGADYAVATSGLAGPGGGSAERPVGLVWIGIASEKGTKTYSRIYSNDRKRNIERFAAAALDLLRRTIIDENR